MAEGTNYEPTSIHKVYENIQCIVTNRIILIHSAEQFGNKSSQVTQDLILVILHLRLSVAFVLATIQSKPGSIISNKFIVGSMVVGPPVLNESFLSTGLIIVSTGSLGSVRSSVSVVFVNTLVLPRKK